MNEKQKAKLNKEIKEANEKKKEMNKFVNDFADKMFKHNPKAKRLTICVIQDNPQFETLGDEKVYGIVIKNKKFGVKLK